MHAMVATGGPPVLCMASPKDHNVQVLYDIETMTAASQTDWHTLYAM